MREKNVGRLASFHTNLDDPYFLTRDALNAALNSSLRFASGRLLDIGCGNKPYEKLFGNVESYLGCDIVQSSEQRVDIISNAMRLPLSSQSFDTVICVQVIEHVEDHQALCSEAYRVLMPGGYFLVAGPMYWHLHEEPYDFFRFTKHGFRYVLEKAGFEIVKILPNGGKWAVLGQVLIHTAGTKSYTRRGFIRAVNVFFAWLDAKHFDDFNTLNYVAVARRKS